MTLTFSGARIEGDVTIIEAWTCDAICSVDQRWSARVTHPIRRFHDLEHGSVSGGGLFTFDPVTFEVALDEVLVITAADEHDD